MCKSENMPRGAAYSAAKLAPSVFRSSLARGSCSKGTMYIVSKHPITSDCPQKVGQAIGETNLLRRRWRGDALSPHDQTAIQTKLQALHTNGQWLACDCTGGGPRPPVFSVASRSSRGQTTYFLRRMTDRAPHLISCPFAFEETQDHGLPRPRRVGVALTWLRGLGAGPPRGGLGAGRSRSGQAAAQLGQLPRVVCGLGILSTRSWRARIAA